MHGQNEEPPPPKGKQIDRMKTETKQEGTAKWGLQVLGPSRHSSQPALCSSVSGLGVASFPVCLLTGQGPACSPGSKVAEGLRAAAASLAIMGEMRPLLAEILSMMEAGGTEREVAAVGAESPALEAIRAGMSGEAEVVAPEDTEPRSPGDPTGNEALPRLGSRGK